MEKNLNYYLNLPYKIELVEDKEEGGFAVACPELPGCISCGATVDEAYRMIEDAKEAWIVSALENGDPIPQPLLIDDFSGQFKLRIPKSLHRTLSIKSQEEGISMNQYCVYLLSKGVV